MEASEPDVRNKHGVAQIRAHGHKTVAAQVIGDELGVGDLPPPDIMENEDTNLASWAIHCRGGHISWCVAHKALLANERRGIASNAEAARAIHVQCDDFLCLFPASSIDRMHVQVRNLNKHTLGGTHKTR